MKYFHYCNDKGFAIQQWNNSQFDLSDIVLSLTDNDIFIGAKIYAIFCRPEVLNLMQYFVCDLNNIKRELGIEGDYVGRNGNLYSKSFNPSRNTIALKYSRTEMKEIATSIYKNIMLDLKTIALNNC